MAAAALVVAGSGPAAAHVAITLAIVSPASGAVVGPDPNVIVFANRTLGGVDAVTFTVSVDGRPYDPDTGLPARRPASMRVRASNAVQFVLRDLPPGRHALVVTYRPDVDEPPHTNRVAFVVRKEGLSALAWVAGGAGVLAVLAVVILLLLRPGRAARSAGPPPAGRAGAGRPAGGPIRRRGGVRS